MVQTGVPDQDRISETQQEIQGPWLVQTRTVHVNSFSRTSLE